MGNTYKPDHRQRIQCSVGKFLEYKTDATATAFPQEISLSLRPNLKNQRIGARLRKKRSRWAFRQSGWGGSCGWLFPHLQLDRRDRRLELVDRPWRQKRPLRSTAAVRLTVGSATRRLKSFSCNTTLGSARTFAESRLSSRCFPRLDWLRRLPRAINGGGARMTNAGALTGLFSNPRLFDKFSPLPSP